MPTAIKIWEISGQQLRPTQESSLSEQHLENELETWICQNPELLGDRLLIIDRQRDIPGVGRLDLLAIDESGKLVIIELKRDRAPREAVAQALDYASWLDSSGEEQIESNAESYLKSPLSDAFTEFFHVEIPEYTCQNHRIVLVAPRLDESAERIINYLAERHRVEINAVFFRYCKLGDGKEILARSVLVSEAPPPIQHRYRRSVAEILALAADRKTTDLIEICRQMRHNWKETPTMTFGGSFRYWASSKPGSQQRMIFGVNAAGNRNPPTGQLDLWIPPKSLAEVTGVPEPEVRQSLEKVTKVPDPKTYDYWIRLKTTEDAQALVNQLRAWVEAQSGASAAQA